MQPPKRVVFLMDDLHRPNGIVSATDLLATELEARGCEVEIWCFGRCDADFPQRHDVIAPVPGRRLTSHVPGFAASRRALKPVRYAASVVWWPWTAGRLRRLAARWDEDTLVIGAGLDSVRLLTQSGVRPAHLVSQVHLGVNRLSREQIGMVRGAATVSQAITGLTADDARALRSYGIRAFAMANPAPTAPRADPTTSRTVVFLGRLSEVKQVDHLIRAFDASAPAGWRLRVYGSGPEEERLRALADAARSDVELCGSVSDVGRVLQAAAIHVLPSRAEGLPMCILEANMAGVPTVAYDCAPGLGVAMGPSDLLLPLGDEERLRSVLGDLMRDDAARGREGERAYRYGQRFGAPAVVNAWTDLWNVLAAEA